MILLLSIFIIFSPCYAESQDDDLSRRQMPSQQADNLRKRFAVASSTMLLVANVAGLGLDIFAATPHSSLNGYIRIASCFTGLNHLASAYNVESASEETKGRLIASNTVALITTGVILSMASLNPTVSMVYGWKGVTQLVTLVYSLF